MTSTAEALPLDFESFLEWERKQPGRHEFHQGEILDMVGTTDRHNTVSGNFYMLLRQQLRGTPCKVFMADVMLQVEAAEAGYYPDLMVTCAGSDLGNRYVKREPVVLVEVLSESTATYDLGDKFAAYRQLPSLREYVLVDPERPRVQVFRPGPGGHWVLYSFGTGETIRLESIEFEAPLTALYEE